MKRILLCCLVCLVYVGTIQAETSAWTSDELYQANTAMNCSYMSQIEKDVMMYLNLARLFPQRFAEIEVQPYKKPQGFSVSTAFQTYKQSLLDHLNTMEPRKAIQPDYDCYQLAYCWAEESGRLGIRGHKRVECPKGDNAECCSYGVYTAIDIVLQWLVDDHVPSLGHRTICLSARYSKAGIAFMKHSTEEHVTVLDIK